MNILLLGSGGREHTLAWKMKQSPLCNQLFIAPGNAGTALCGANVAIGVNDFAAINNFCNENAIDMIVVGPEEPLVLGVYDYFQQPGTWKGMVIGPSGNAAQMEGSKAFSKKFMQRHGIPTAAYEEFSADSFAEGKAYIQHHSLPVVLKADGLAAGKGVVICNTTKEALQAFEEMILHKQFGEASSKVVIEQFLSGIEVSVFVITDGKDYKIIGHAKDYKRIGEGDTGLNTGGMGCVSPVPFMQGEFMQRVEETIIKPTIKGIYEEQLAYTGFVFFGLINVNGEPYVIEYNCRMGDPETEVVLPRLQNDILELFVAAHNKTLGNVAIELEDKSYAVVVAVSGGYPGNYKKNIPMQLPATIAGDTFIFHAGTKQQGGETLTNGGRVLAVSSSGTNIKDAVEKSTDVLRQVSYEGMYYRGDIGYEF